ncbi:hypothetical protein F7725_024143 [Dissostichus mawsoni]|uniref:EGF-like domain-containing protein n=1 Tax=Dissostichus mawsoni TaxID=36200 RepID=A0A7J5XYL3_DISMA|nr:hypothetical protein F7725_024143 [Dissostichus mawsoni]
MRYATGLLVPLKWHSLGSLLSSALTLLRIHWGLLIHDHLIYLSGFEGSWCEIDTNECSSNPCQNQGDCVDRVNGYGKDCECKMGFSGLHCEEDINECTSSPCHNSAICQDLVNKFTCVCPRGYFGTLCDLDVNECEVSPCLHEGICINTLGGFECVCRPGYSGSSLPSGDVKINMRV